MKTLLKIVCVLAATACLLAAQDDPPGRVARLSYTYGSVSFRPGEVDDWFPADFNRPLTTGDHLFVDFAGTAEMQLGATVLRVGSRSTMDILNLDDSNVQLRLSEGTLVIRVRELSDQDSMEIDTPNLAFSPLRPGEYRIDVKPDLSTTIVTVRGGNGELNGPDQAFTVRAGEQTIVTGADQPSYQTLGVPPRDTLDNFALQRDQREDQMVSTRYCSPEMVGYQDLDRYGSWRDAPDYGMVWVPNGMPAGWAPYHFGHWVWIDPWGWTWVDDAPWGFAPFHYGRWAYVGYWAWVPGPRAERPVYAPALVAWVGGGTAGAAIGGGVAWFALGPRDVYVPSYHTSPAYLNRVNVSNTVIVNNVNITNVNVTNVNYVNRGAPGAVMAVQRDAFAKARPVQSAAIQVRPDVMRGAAVTRGAAIAPTRASIVRGPAPGAQVARPPAAIESRAVVAKRAPPPAPVPFAQKQAAIAANGGRPLETQQVQQLRQRQPPPPQPVVRQVQARPVQARPVQARPLPSNVPPPQVQQRPLQQQPRQPAPREAAPLRATPEPAPVVRPNPATPAVQRPTPPAAVQRPTPPPAVQRSVPPPAVQPATPRPGAQPPAPEAQRPNRPTGRPAPNKAPANEDKRGKEKEKDKKE